MLFFLQDPATTKIYTLSLHDALPIYEKWGGFSNLKIEIDLPGLAGFATGLLQADQATSNRNRSEEHTSELQSHSDLVCRLLLEKKKKNKSNSIGTCRSISM